MKNIKYISLLFLLLAISGCNKFYDVNVPTNVVDSEDLELNLILPTVEYNTVTLQFSKAFSMGQLQQQIASFGNEGVDQHYPSSMRGVWDKYYTRILLPLKEMDKLADEQSATHYKGVIKVLEALSLGMMTDTYGDVPFEEAGLGGENLQPAVEDQQTLYGKIQVKLDEAITFLTATDNTIWDDVPGDIIYNGDMSKWTRLAYTLKARYALHLTKRNGVQAAQDALTYLQNGFTSNADDFQLSFDEKSKNPWYVSVIQSQNSANFTVLFSEQLINYMNGTDYLTAAPDPRIFDYVDNNGAATFNGAVNGNEGDDASGNGANTLLNENGYYFKFDSPVVLATYSEALFIKAEAEFLVNGGNTTSVGSNQAAYDAYKDAITANMNKLGIDPALRDAYLVDPAIDVTPAQLKLEHIMKEKDIALLLNPEIFNDMKRYDFSTDVYKNLELPMNQDPDMGGQWFRRPIYPTSELTKNTNLVQHHVYDTFWWDN